LESFKHSMQTGSQEGEWLANVVKGFH